MTTSERAVNPQRAGVGLRESNPALADAFEKRQRDTGWGYAIAHDLPGVWIFYAITRKTITPFLWSTAYGLAAGLVVGLIIGITAPDSAKKLDESKLESVGMLVGLLVSPFGAKHGINAAREYARRRLDSNS